MNTKTMGRSAAVRRVVAAGITAVAIAAPIATFANGGPALVLASSNHTHPSPPADTQSTPCPGAYFCTRPGTDPMLPYGTDPLVPYGPDPVGPGANSAF